MRASKAQSRSTWTIKRGYARQASVRALTINGRKWTLYANSLGEHCQHNHPPEDSKFPSSKRFGPEDIATVLSFLDQPAVSNREMATQLRKRDPKLVFTRRQLRNYRYRLRRQRLRGWTPTQATIRLLNERNIPHTIK
ncbi:hypothetical protein B0H67DRAFT_591639 [Lasiosphaeris hirsuta]|uniref:Uncharacterized protein n=1 Tax=Lasiosphaeris hirsuta TaxID=260670 RepID=A0AA40DIL7_9PEZI|nr:hypothetical protein B0H67DRAFT_591639 [Lasiosphaeris hirsuta]